MGFIQTRQLASNSPSLLKEGVAGLGTTKGEVLIFVLSAICVVINVYD